LKTLAIAILFVFGLLLGASNSSRALTLVHFKQNPDFRFSLNLPQAEFAKMRIILLDFGHAQKMTEFDAKNAPRAKGKEFYLSMSRDDANAILFIAEKVPGDVFHIDCYELSPGSGIYPMVSDLKAVLQKNWPNIPLAVASRWLERNPPPPVHLIAPVDPKHIH